MLGRDMLNLHNLGADVEGQGAGLQEGVVEFKPKVTTTFGSQQTPRLFETANSENKGPQARKGLF